jgi:hypothetical protein
LALLAVFVKVKLGYTLLNLAMKHSIHRKIDRLAQLLLLVLAFFYAVIMSGQNLHIKRGKKGGVILELFLTGIGDSQQAKN